MDNPAPLTPEQIVASTKADFAYIIPLEKFVYKVNGAWALDRPVSRDGIKHYLKSRGWPQELVTAALKLNEYLTVSDVVMVPNRPSLYKDKEGHTYINTWVPPVFEAKRNQFPSISWVLNWLTQGDQEGIRWLIHWMALKVQNPEIVPKVAVVLTTEPGGGKGTLAFLMRCMLGNENCATIGREALENKFNSRWSQKLFVLADEVLSSENLRDVSDRLKMLIDAHEIELEGKGKDQRSVRNRLAWMFASNSRITPVNIERNDRRYTVFSNHDPLPTAYVDMLNGCFLPDRVTPTEAFKTEIQGFFHHLLNEVEVDRAFVSRPYTNEARTSLIEANAPSHERFCRQVDEEGIDDLADKVMQNGHNFDLSRKRHLWDFGENGISTEVLYMCYSDFCRDSGSRPLARNKFGQALQNHRPVWRQVRNTVSGTDKRVNCYVVRRRQEKALKLVGGVK